MEIIAIPGSHAFLAIVGVFFRDIDSPSDGIRLADPVGAPALRYRFAELDHPGAGGNAIFGIDPAGKLARRGTVGEHQARGHRGSPPRYQ